MVAATCDAIELLTDIIASADMTVSRLTTGMDVATRNEVFNTAAAICIAQPIKAVSLKIPLDYFLDVHCLLLAAARFASGGGVHEVKILPACRLVH